MSLKLITLGAVLASAWLLTSCTHYYYAPNMHNVPLFREKNEVRIAGAISGGDEFVGREVQVAYSINDHIGIMANGIWANDGDNVKVDNVIGRLAEIGIGYYQPLGEQGVFEVYGGPGIGRMNDYNYGYDFQANITRLFIQPAIGYKSRHFEAALSTRLARLHYNYFVTEDYYAPVNPDPDIAKVNYLMFEPAATIRVGLKNVKLQLQAGYSKQLTDKYFMQEKFNFNAGLIVQLGRKQP